MEGDCRGEEPLSTPAEANRGRGGWGHKGKVMEGDKIRRPTIRQFPGGVTFSQRGAGLTGGRFACKKVTKMTSFASMQNSSYAQMHVFLGVGQGCAAVDWWGEEIEVWSRRGVEGGRPGL